MIRAGFLLYRCGLISLLFFSVLSSPKAFAEKVKHVIDGDTVVLENNQRVRLIGVDAPEVDNPKYNRLGEPFGNEAREYLESRVAGKEVDLEGGGEPFDQYGRRLAYVFHDGRLINAELIELGYAEAFRKFPHPRHEDFLRLEETARLEAVGIWSGRKPEPRVSSMEWNEEKWIWIGLALLILRTLFIWFRKLRP